MAVVDTRGLRYHGAGDLRVETAALRELGNGGVVVAVDACAVCESDLAFVAGTARPRRVPVTLGHEVAGTVAASRAPGWQAGDEVVVTAGLPCGACRPCADGRSNLCEHLVLLGVDVDGGMADRLVVSGNSLVRRPPGLAAATAATADPAAAAYHALARRGELRHGDAAVVIGVGVPGALAVQIAKLLGAAPVIAVDADRAAAHRIAALGADEVLVQEPGRSVGREIKLLTDGGADVAVDFAGTPSTVDIAVKSLRPGGIAVTAGLGSDPVTAVPPLLWSLHEYELRGAFGSHPGDLDHVLGWLDDGKLHPPDLDPVSLDEAPSAITDRAGSRPAARLVVRP